MTSISADQLIYTNVEADRSPSNRRGYQVLFYTHDGLSDAEVVAIETRLFYRPPEAGNRGETAEMPRQPTKHVFFQTKTGKIVLAQIAPLPETDKFGRSGRCFAHALIFSPDAFAQFENNPFVVFQRFPFWTTVEQAFRAGDPKNGNIPPTEVSSERLGRQNNSLSLIKDRETLLLLTTQAARLLENRRAIGFVGQTGEIFQLLEALFDLIPPPSRLQCSFDTLFTGGTLNRAPYWAVGFPSAPPRQPNLHLFDLEARQFTGDVSAEPTGAFERWLIHVTTETEANPQFADIAEHIEPACWLGRWFDGESLDLRTLEALEAVDLMLFQSFDELNPNTLEERVTEQLQKQVGDALGERIFDQAFSWVRKQGAGTPRHLEGGFDIERLQNWIFGIYDDSPNRPEPQELQNLRQFLEVHPHVRLRLIYLRWARDWQSLTEDLLNLEKQDLNWFAKWAFRTVQSEVTWGIRHDDQGLSFGPIVKTEKQDSEDCRHLLLTLLDMSDKLFSDLPSGSPRKGILGRRVRRKVESSVTPLELPLSDINIGRWLWLIEFLSK
jgi:hypothetical protein